MESRIVLCFIVAILFQVSSSFRLLLVPTGGMSHFAEMHSVAHELLNRGHEVSILLETSQQNEIRKIDQRYNMMNFSGIPLLKMEGDSSCLLQSVTSWTILNCVTREMREMCISLLENQALWSRLDSSEFDLVMIDEFILQCVYLIPHRLKAKHVAIGSHFGLRYLTLPLLPSLHSPLYGFELLGFHFCDEDSNCPRLLKVIRR